MNQYLNTDDLLAKVSESQAKIKEQKPKGKKINYKKIIFVSIAVLAVLHLVFMAIPLVLQERSRDILGYQYVVVIQQDQPLATELKGHVVLLERINRDALKIGDKVLIFGLYGSEYYWEVEINAIDAVNQTVLATFDNVITNEYTFNQVTGAAGRNANVFGVAYYTASTISGFIYMTLFHIIIVGVLYYTMFKLEPIKDLRKKS